MKNIGKRTLSVLLTLVMVLSMVAVPGMSVLAVDESHVYNYDYRNIIGGGITEQGVEDGDAYLGKANYYASVNLSADYMPVRRYETDTKADQLLGRIAKSSFKVNQGYNTYSITTTLTEDAFTSENALVYITGGWTIQCAAMGPYLNNFAGKSVTINISMKIVAEDETDLSAAQVYVDRIQLVSHCKDYAGEDGKCTLCGVLVDNTVPHELKNYDYSRFNGSDNAVEDAEAYLGMAKIYENRDLSSGMTIYAYDRGSAKTDKTKESREIGKIAVQDLQANLTAGGYHTYELTFTVPEDLSDDVPQVYFYSTWSPNCAMMGLDLVQYKGQTITVVFSMKITGDSLSNVTMYMDNAKLVEPCDKYYGSDRVCTVCGAQKPINPAAHDLKTYDYWRFGGSNEVDDAEAAGGKAKTFAGLNLSDGMNVYIYDRGSAATDKSKESRLVGVFKAEEFELNNGYKNYEMVIQVPADLSNDIPYFYMDGMWSFNNAMMGLDIREFKGQTVKIRFTLKITGEDLSSATVYASGAAIRSLCTYNGSGYCPTCGIDMPVDTSVHNYKTYEYWRYPGDDSNTVEDAEANGGLARYYEGKDLSKGMNFYIYDRGTNGRSVFIGAIPAAKIQVDKGYQKYEITFKVPADLSSDVPLVYFDGSWSPNLAEAGYNLRDHKGETVTLVISMKVTGTLSSATMYFDGGELREACDAYRSEEGNFCTKCGAALPAEKMPAELDEKHLQKVYSYVEIDKKGDEFYVYDTDAFKEVAWNYEMNLTDGLDLRWYKAGVTDFSLMQVSLDDLKANEGKGYVYYKGTVIVPDTIPESGDYTYLAWRSTSSKLANDLIAYAGQTVEIYLSVKVSGLYVRESDGKTLGQVYVDQIIVADSCRSHQVGSTCSVCGKEAEINPEAHIRYTYTYEKLNGSDNTVEDTDSTLGSSKVYTARDLSGGLPVYLYDRGTGASHHIGTVPVATLEANKNNGYFTYELTFNVPRSLTNDLPYVYFTGSWSPNCAQMAKDLKTLAGQTVTVQFSAKIVGEDLAAADLYVDKLAVIDYCEDHVSANGTYCTRCGASVIDETRPEELKDIHPKHLESYDVADFYRGLTPAEITEDADSVLGQAFKEAEVEIGDTLYLSRYTNADGGLYWDLMTLNTWDINFDGAYHLYSNTVTVPEDITTATYVTLHANNIKEWFCQNYLISSELMNFAGKEVTIYLSMKAVGDETMCDIYIDRMFLVSNCDWDNGVVTQEPTVDAEGVMTYTCQICGATKTEAIEKLSPVNEWNVSLDGNVSLNFDLNVSNMENSMVEYTFNGDTITEFASDLVDENGKIALNLELAAAQMSDTVTIAVTDMDTMETVEKSYSVKDYAAAIIDGNYDDATKNMVKAMLTYGAASQTYFQYNANALANDGISFELTAPTQSAKFAVEGASEAVKFYGASLVHENKIAIRIYFTGDVAGKTITVNGEAATAQAKGNLYYVEVADICPQDLDNSIVVEIDGLTVTYAPMDYIVRMYAKGGKSAELVKALYSYYLAAEAYTAA